MPAPATSPTRQLMRAATLVMALFFLSRVMGLVREMVIGARFGTSAELDAYLAAFRVPDTLFQLMAGGALGSAFIPVFAGLLARRELPAAWRLLSAALNLVLALMTVLALVAALVAPFLVSTLLAPGFSPAQQALTVSLMRWMLISTVVFGLSGIMMAALNSFQHFLLPALAPVLYNLSIIAGAWFLTPTIGVYGLVIGVVVGAFLHLDSQIIGLWWYRARYRATFGLADPPVREVARLMGPRVLGLAAVQLNFWVNTLLASGLAAGSLSALNYAWLLMLLPEGIVAQAVATAAFPTFAALEARGQLVELRKVVSQTLRGVLFLAIPAAAGLFAWRVPLIRLLLERGQFTATSTELTAAALAFYAFGLIGHSVVEIAARAFYALHDTRTPVIVTFAGVALNVALSLALLPSLSYAGLALANTLAILVEMAVLLWLLARRLGGLEWPQLSATVIRATLASAGMMAALLWLGRFEPGYPSLLYGGAGLGLGALIYLGAAVVLRMPEVQIVRRLIKR